MANLRPLLLITLVFLGIRTLAEGAYASQLTWIIATIGFKIKIESLALPFIGIGAAVVAIIGWFAVLFTGRWPGELSAGWDAPLDRTTPTLAEVLDRVLQDVREQGLDVLSSRVAGEYAAFRRFEAEHPGWTVVTSSGAGTRSS